MSKRVELLEKKDEFLRRELDNFKTVLSEIEADRFKDFKAVAEKYFGEVLTIEGDKIEVSDSKIEFLRIDPERKYSKEVLTIYLRGESFSYTEVDRLETSFYSTSENSEFELNRMVLLGKTAEIIIDHRDDILAEWNFVTESFNVEMNDARKKVWNAEKLVSENDDKITTLENEMVKEKLFGEGIKFSIPEDGSLRRLPSLQARWDWSVDKITSIKVTRKTTSGKSYDVEGTFAISRWDDESKKSYITESTFDCNSVRADKVEYMLHFNRELIKE